ncbi:MAG: bifunctional adenosylcobinamide kinase/adenosylcobinamide-phosphate guanylyltransferase [Victivallales bacterium]|nr:bifunctional adenosylcobinamide kinase/adenosylcobinamide-phosphate guanylyltransferase [Victivallales bacterium]
MSCKVALVTGGCRSGKSDHALQLALNHTRRVFIATAEATDDEMVRRIRRHQEERGGLFQTVEEPLHLAQAIETVPAGTEVILIDCLPVWLGNLSHHGRMPGNEESCAEIEAFIKALASAPCDVIVVTGEIGLGLVPAEASTRLYRDRLGRLNRNVATVADDVYFVVSGLPMKLK